MMQEVIANAAATGVPLHICHVTSKGLNDTAVILEVIAGARRNGLDITTEAYPYTAGSTAIGNALFNDGWQQRFGADFSDIEWPATGERLTAETFARYRQEQPSTSVIFHVIPESAMDFAIAHPLVMIASDGGAYVGGYGHPRGAGTNARVLGTYVRERKVLTLMDALRKMTLMPAQRLEKFAPVMRRKGRLQEGMDADITIFDPQTVTDRAGYGKPTLPSEGIPYVLADRARRPSRARDPGGCCCISMTLPTTGMGWGRCRATCAPRVICTLGSDRRVSSLERSTFCGMQGAGTLP
jgi:N-acyl-D-aspartate/D-glutamate deacylase